MACRLLCNDCFFYAWKFNFGHPNRCIDPICYAAAMEECFFYSFVLAELFITAAIINKPLLLLSILALMNYKAMTTISEKVILSKEGSVSL